MFPPPPLLETQNLPHAAKHRNDVSTVPDNSTARFSKCAGFIFYFFILLPQV
uniref:Uncharacterized protein n=1 Tax=Anguilla anguilla TaxID=7936 RepID=A0A0E9QGU4_ANGAN